MPNATPGFLIYTRFKKPEISSTDSLSRSEEETINFET